MKRSLWIAVSLLIPVASTLAATSVTVAKSGGNYTTIQAALNSGASTITITDSGTYQEDLTIGTLGSPGSPVTLTSTKAGTNRPVITPLAGQLFPDTHRGDQQAGIGFFANNSVVANVIIEANPDLLANGVGGMVLMATNSVIENCLFRIATNTVGTLNSQNSLLFFAQQDSGSGGSQVAMPGGPDCNGCLVRNCEFISMAPDANPVEPTGTGYDINSVPDGSQGYLGEKAGTPPGLGTGQGSGYVRTDHYSDGRDTTITIEGCWFHYDRDYGIFPSNRQSGAGSHNFIIKNCRFDATSKFCIRARGANIVVENSVFTRWCQGNNGDDENAAVAINNQDGHIGHGSVKNCVFMNGGSAYAKRAYYGGVNNHDSTDPLGMAVNNCTFVDCLTGVADAHGGSGGVNLFVTNSIFHHIGDNVPPSADVLGVTLTNGSPELVGGLYPAWTNGLVNFAIDGGGAFIWSAVFNRFQEKPSSVITIDHCMVGSIDTEDSRSWDQVATNGLTPPEPGVFTNVLGCRLYAGYDTNFVGQGTVTRAIPVFLNQNPDALNPFQLAPSSPGQGLGANLAPVLEPKLAVAQAGSQVTISWSQPIWVSGYILKSTSSLSSPVWTAVPSVVDKGGGAYSVPVTIGAGNQYFAVRQSP
jgi:hypothetical protein